MHWDVDAAVVLFKVLASSVLSSAATLPLESQGLHGVEMAFSWPEPAVCLLLEWRCVVTCVFPGAAAAGSFASRSPRKMPNVLS